MHLRKISMLQLLLIVLCFLGYSYASAQTDYLVLTKGDTLPGKVNHLNYGINQKVQLVDDSKKKTIYSMIEVKAFRMDDEDYQLIKMGDKYMYMKPVQEGYLSLYSFQLENQITWDGKYLYKKDGTGIEVPNLGFKKRLAEFVNECPELADEIKSGQLGKNELNEIITKFNACIDLRSGIQQRPAVEKIITPSASVNLWSELESAVRATENLSDKQDVLEMILDAKSKTERGQKIPNFLIEGLTKSLEKQEALKELLTKALSEINK